MDDRKIKVQEFKLEALVHFEDYLANDDIAKYLMSCLPDINYKASTAWVLNLDSLLIENFQKTPGAIIFPYGFLVFAVTPGGNGICVNVSNGRVYFADHGSFHKGGVDYKDPGTGDLRSIDELSHETILKGMKELDENIEAFIQSLLAEDLISVIKNHDIY